MAIGNGVGQVWKKTEYLRAHLGSAEKGSVGIVDIVMLLLINIKLSILIIYKIESSSIHCPSNNKDVASSRLRDSLLKIERLEYQHNDDS